MKTNKKIWEDLKKRTNELIEVAEKKGLLSHEEVNSIDRDKFFYSNGNDNTEFDIKANGKLCEIGVLYQGTFNSAVQLNIYEDGKVAFSVFDKDLNKKVGIRDFTILDDEEFRQFATTIYNEMDNKNKYDTYLEDDFFTDDEVEIEVDLFLQEIDPEYDENGDEIDQEQEFKSFYIPTSMGYEDSMSVEKKIDASLVSKYLEEIESGMKQLAEKGHKSFVILEKEEFYFQDINYSNEKFDINDCVFIHSKNFNEMADKALKTMAIYGVEFDKGLFSENSDIAKVYGDFAKNVENFRDSDGIVRVNHKLKDYTEIIDDTLKNLEVNGLAEGIKIQYSNNDDEYRSNIKIVKDDLKFEKEIGNITYEGEKNYSLKTIPSMLVSEKYSQKYIEKSFKEKENIFKREYRINDVKHFTEKAEKINENFKNIEVEEIKSYVKAKSLEEADSLGKSTELLDEIFGAENSIFFKRSYLYEKANDYGLTQGRDGLGNKVLVNLYNPDTNVERNTINDFFISVIKNPIQQEIVELKELGEKPKYENKKIDGYLKNKDDFLNDLYSAKWNDKFLSIENLNNMVAILEGKELEIDINRFNRLLENNDLPTVTDKKFEELKKNFNPKEYNIGFEINVEKVKENRKEKVEKTEEIKKSKEMDM